MSRLIPPGYSATWPHMSARRRATPWWAAARYIATDAATGEKIPPSVVLDFSGARYMPALTDAISFTRAGTATDVDADGLLKTAEVDVPRFDYTNGRRQLLLEGPATNLLPFSEDFSQWTKPGGTIVTSNNTISPRGVLDASKIENALGRPSTTWSYTSSGGVMLFSCFLRAGTTDQISIVTDGRFAVRFDLSVATATVEAEVGGWSVVDTFMRPLSGGWWRCSAIVSTNAVESRFFTIRGEETGASYYSWGAQLETGSQLSSYIPTDGTTVTRPADKAQLAEPVAALLRNGEASVLVQGQRTHLAPNDSAGRILSGPGWLDYLMLLRNSQIAAGFPELSLSGTTLPLPSYGVTVGWDDAGIKGVYSGNGSLASRADAQGATFATAYLGRSGQSSAGFAPGWYDQLVIWPSRTTDSDLQAKAVAYA